MKRRNFVPIAALAAAACTAAPSRAASFDDWSGTWTARLKNKPFLILKLTSGAGRLTGSLRAGQVETDERGNVTSVQSPPERDYPLKFMKLTGPVLSFRTIDAEGDAIEYEMRLKGEASAELRLPAAPGPLAPFALTRE